MAEAAKQKMVGLLSGGKSVTDTAADYEKAVNEFLAAGGPSEDPLVIVAERVYGIILPGLPDRAADPAFRRQRPEEAVDNVDLLPFDYLEEFMIDTLEGYGVPREEAKVCADVLIEADRRGITSHGIGRLKPIYCDRIVQGILKPTAPFEVVREDETTALVDGHLGMGLVIGPKCMQMAIDKAKKTGVSCVAVRNSTHYGIAGYYTLMAAKNGCIGITGTNARPSIAPTFGVEGMIGTNPLTVGCPSADDFPFVLDCATSITQRGKIEAYARAGKATPTGCVIDRQGHLRTDTDQILIDLVKGEAALMPLGGAYETGGYKGYGYATFIEILCSSLQDNPFGKALRGVDDDGKKVPMPLGHFFIAIDIERFVSLDFFKGRTKEILDGLRGSAKMPGYDRIYTAGEPEHEAMLRQGVGQEHKEGFGVPIGLALKKDMDDIRAKVPAIKEKYASYPWEK